MSVTPFRRLVAVFATALIVATWRLWTPQDQFPQIPFLEWLCRAPAWLDWLALSGMTIGLLLCVLGGDARPLPRTGLSLFTACLAASVLLDQHRLQPWAYQFLIAGAVLCLVPTAYGLRLLRLLVVSIYLWSAVSKLDSAFLESHGQLLLDGLIRAVRLDEWEWSPVTGRAAAAAFPLGELVIGVLLSVPRTRIWGLGGSLVMHGVLLLSLGPFGLDHKPGVLIWNAYFIGQNLLLFRRVGSVEANAPRRRVEGTGAAAATTLVALAAILPALESIGRWDHWPSWAVYSSRPAIVTMLVHDTRIDDLPPSLQLCVGPSEPLSEWRPVSIEHWSFQAVNCPVYPQERYRLAVIRAVAEQADLRDDVIVRLESAPDRWTGKRAQRELRGIAGIRARCGDFWLNTRARSVYQKR